ncbi:putative indole-3-pyruvate monooxygenase YUCCA8 [Pseudocercospora fuligena]|uniref:Putative indole-3-pyruvate monooxygenase YUCCA8 n=1 Tax=Pseudocercospora fuligena TaxID=685502 RepID=A0A8H6RS68_9PEZI|nr:putative indole-3-pyruvate monooxygenase YUCCA8 [Pseudocercospora fuligena]
MATTKMRTASAVFDDIPGELPATQILADVDLKSIANSAIESLNALQEDDLAANATWRDLLSFTDTFRTFSSAISVNDKLSELRRRRQCSPFRIAAAVPRLVNISESSWIDIDFEFEIRDGDLIGECSGVVSVIDDGAGQFKIWMLRTWLERYSGHGDPDRSPIVESSNQLNACNGSYPKQTYDVVVVGGGQAGLGVAGRLRALGIDYILFDDRPSIGDSWAHRYDSLKFHTIREYGNLPFGRTWDESDPQELPKDRIASGYKEWAEKHELNARADTLVEHAQWDQTSSMWTVKTLRASDQSDHSECKAKYLILCMGVGHKVPVSPDWATTSKVKTSGYKGTIIHASDYHNARDFGGRRGIVIGTANTAHDVAEDMANAGMDVTMCQRNPTFIFPQAWLVAAESRDYNMQKLTEVADREQVTMPTKITRQIVNRTVHGLIGRNPELFDGLERAGFRVDRYGDLFTHLYIRYGGHYVDIGASERIIKGEIKVKTTPIKGLSADGLVFGDESHLEADLIVLATGFNHDFRKDAAEIIGQNSADQMDHFWQPDGEGELRGYARLSGHPNLFYHGAEARLARFFSRFVALQIQKELLGKPLEPYLDSRPGMQLQ